MRTLATLFLALLFAACGGDDAGNDTDEAAAGDSAASFETWAAGVELTDDMMEDFFAVAEEMKGTENDPAKGLAVMAKHDWDMQRFTWVAGQLGMALQAEAITDSRADIERGFEEMNAEMERLRKRAAAATGKEQEKHEHQLEQYEKIYEAQKKTLAPMLEGAAKSAEKNRAILQKYRDRWEALGR